MDRRPVRHACPERDRPAMHCQLLRRHVLVEERVVVQERVGYRPNPLETTEWLFGQGDRDRVEGRPIGVEVSRFRHVEGRPRLPNS